MPRIKYKEVAGLEVKKGRPASGKKPTREELVRLYLKEDKSIREIAATLSCSKDMVNRAMKEYKINARPWRKRSSLRVFSPRTLRKQIESKGVGGTAQFLAVNETTLRRYLKQQEKKG